MTVHICNVYGKIGIEDCSILRNKRRALSWVQGRGFGATLWKPSTLYICQSVLPMNFTRNYIIWSQLVILTHRTTGLHTQQKNAEKCRKIIHCQLVHTLWKILCEYSLHNAPHFFNSHCSTGIQTHLVGLGECSSWSGKAKLPNDTCILHWKSASGVLLSAILQNVEVFTKQPSQLTKNTMQKRHILTTFTLSTTFPPIYVSRDGFSKWTAGEWV